MLAHFPDHHEKYYPSDQHDPAPHPLLSDTHRHVRTEITADERATRHQERVFPDDISRACEDQHRHRVDADAEKVFDAVGAMQLVETENAHSREHEYAVTGAEIAAIHRGDELKDNRASPPE